MHNFSWIFKIVFQHIKLNVIIGMNVSNNLLLYIWAGVRWQLSSCVRSCQDHCRLHCCYWETANWTLSTGLGWRLFVDNDFWRTRFLKWANSSGHFFEGEFSWPLLVTSRGHSLSMIILLLRWIFMDVFCVNSSGHFLMVTNSANTVDQPTQRVRGRSPY